MNRRAALATLSTGALAVLFGAVRKGLGTPISFNLAAPLAMESGVRIKTLEELLSEHEDRGTAAPYRREVDFAKQIIYNTPSNCSPLEVANFFLQVRSGYYDQTFGQDASTYCEEWPVRANPIIVTFFDATTLRKPNGDQTAWCAAFVNWCLLRSREGRAGKVVLTPATLSAASSSFRSWGSETKSPVAGDVVVFEHRREPAKGHVGFFSGMDGGGVYVVGGNQMPIRAKLPDGTYERRNTGEVNVKWMPINGRDLKFHSFRTDSSLHL